MPPIETKQAENSRTLTSPCQIRFVDSNYKEETIPDLTELSFSKSIVTANHNEIQVQCDSEERL